MAVLKDTLSVKGCKAAVAVAGRPAPSPKDGSMGSPTSVAVDRLLAVDTRRSLSLRVVRDGWLQIGELTRHRRVLPRQLLDRHVLRLVVRKAQVAICALEGFLRFLASSWVE